MSSRLHATREHVVPPSFTPARAAGKPLDAVTRQRMESSFNHDFSRVRIHSDSDAQRSAARIGAAAYTMRTDVVFGAGSHDLAHELTHVVQQTRGTTSSSGEVLESEARGNSERFALGLPARVDGGAAAGTLQCQTKDDEKKKPEGSFTQSSGFTLKPDSVKNKFGFSAELSIPLVQNTKKQPISFLEKLDITETGSKESEKVPAPADIRALQTEAALTVVGLDIPKLLEGRLGTLGLQGNLGGTGNVTLGDEGGTTGSVGGTASADLSYKSPSIVPPGAGSLIFSGKLGAKGSIEQPFGSPDAKFSAKASGKATAGAEYKSPAFGGPAATFLGLLGGKAKVSLGAEGSVSDTAETDKHPSAKVGGSGTFGLTGTGKDERFLKIKVAGEAGLDLSNGGIDPASKATIVEVSVGFKF